MTVWEKLILEMGARSIAVNTPNLHVGSGFRIIIRNNKSSLTIPLEN